VRAQALTPAEAAARVPALVPGAFAAAIFLPDDGHIDVHALLEGYRRGAERAGAELRRGVAVTGIVVERGAVRGVVTAGGETLATRWVVDAAGAWAGPVARLAGAAAIPVTPLRRTIATFATPPGLDASGWPLTIADAHRLYFGPESGGLLVSPMDVTPSEPCDARADDVAIAGAFARMALVAPTLVPTTLRRKWAGLRTFAPDGVPVVGVDPLVRGFFWLAGQGGCGIETSPFVAEIAADLLVEGKTERLDARRLAPERFGPQSSGEL
jgi:D-arginine dehydrogenase